MLERKPIQKTKNFLNKTLKAFLVRYKRLQNALPFNPFSCGSKSQRNHPTDPYCIDFQNEWISELDNSMHKVNNSSISSKEVMKDEDADGGGSFIKFEKQNPVKKKEEKKMGSYSEDKRRMNKDGYALAQKMKDLEMMDVGNMEHLLDVEEAIHYYSRLRSPVYLDIVDNFFVDMYTEFSVPKASISVNSKRRLGSLRFC